MKKYLSSLSLVLGLSSVLALAQVTPQPNPAPTTPPTFPEEQKGKNPSGNPDYQSQLPATSAPSTAFMQAQSKIQEALHKQLPAVADSVTVSSTTGNSIQLSGNVNTDEQKSQVEQIARSVAPDQTIVNKINVSHALGAATTPSATGESAATGQISTMPAASSTGQASSYPSSASGSQSGASGQSSAQSSGALSSAELENNIQKALQRDASLANSNITVSVTNDNKIELSGTVPTEKEKKTAKSIAKANAAGHKVINNIKVANQSSQSIPGSPPR